MDTAKNEKIVINIEEWIESHQQKLLCNLISYINDTMFSRSDSNLLLISLNFYHWRDTNGRNYVETQFLNEDSDCIFCFRINDYHETNVTVNPFWKNIPVEFQSVGFPTMTIQEFFEKYKDLIDLNFSHIIKSESDRDTFVELITKVIMDTLIYGYRNRSRAKRTGLLGEERASDEDDICDCEVYEDEPSPLRFHIVNSHNENPSPRLNIIARHDEVPF